MILLDTNHYSEIEAGSRLGMRLEQRLAASGEACFVSVITTEEAMRGWLQEVKRFQAGPNLVDAYSRFQNSVEDFSFWNIIPWTLEAEGILAELKAKRIRIGTMDLRIASIALSHEALVLTRNLLDFQQVPRLKVENWLD
jgi:tRNA(fMet)-specific endonuclease VapC